MALDGIVPVGVVGDERGLDRLQIARDDLGDALRLVVPGFRATAVLDPSGAVLGRVSVSGRANYLIPPRPGPLISGSEIELFFDHPRIDAGAVDGDGRPDLVTTDRHEIRVFLQREDGRFASQPDRVLAVGRMTEEDHIRSLGTIACDLEDFDRDGRADLLINHSSGGLLAARSENRLHLNRGGSWNLAAPDQVFVTEGGVATVQLIDLDGDGTAEMIDGRIPLGILEIVELLLQRAIDAEVTIYRIGEGGLFGEKPWFERTLGIPFNFETNRPYGFIPTYDADLNGDGYNDLLVAGRGDSVEVYLGGRGEDRFRERVADQEADSNGRLNLGDWNGDGLPDLVLYDSLRPDSPIRLGVNRGLLPGTRPMLVAPD